MLTKLMRKFVIVIMLTELKHSFVATRLHSRAMKAHYDGIVVHLQKALDDNFLRV